MAQSTCQGFLSLDADLWTPAIEHPFLEQCKDASIPLHCFNWWLQQDYGFVLNFQQLSKAVLTQAPELDKPTFASGLAALDDELKFYQAQAASRSLSLEVEEAKVMRDYADLMLSLHTASYPVRAAGFWAIEYIYNQAWQRPGPMKPPYDIFAERWGSQSFTDYVKKLQQHADQALEFAESDQIDSAREICQQIARLEVGVWDAAMEAS